jgi:indolepyruvate ferredoxin oxidoreductase alpha subunit
VVCAGVAYQYAREVFGPQASYLKLGMTYPMPMALIAEFAAKVDKLYVIEEMDPYMEQQLLAAGIPCIGKAIVPEMDELNTDILRQAVFGTQKELIHVEGEAVVRPPTLCGGCPHRGFFYALNKKKNIMVTGDIGCYTLGSAPPLSSMDTCICMGGSISAGHGASVAFRRTGSDKKVVAVIGDSTFFHSGITSLMDVVYNRGNCVTVIMDNRTTGMTGHQENPGTGYTLMGETAVEADIPLLCQAIGIKKENIFTVNPLDLKENHRVLNLCLKSEEPTVIITRWPCAIKAFSENDKKEFDLFRKPLRIDQEKCKKCLACVRTGCPNISSGEQITINPYECTGCAVCKQACAFEAIDPIEAGGNS